MKHLKMGIVAGLLVSLIFLSTFSLGCDPSDRRAEFLAAQKVAGIIGAEEQDLKRSSQSTSQMSESHQMMAIMILNQAGKDTDLNSYEEVYLVDVATEDGSNSYKVVVVETKNGMETIVPDTVKNP